ncbi:hypothetical protein COCC4DRAFT_26298 [Bipolaris maydis ATCC 48331]|uniref:Uncharacterized protein n=2 Tax=Cochliobolus heterostrophus TaxID=5016 RepID=M2SL91_COCH5|nr:uncharacterized protein COCC4DRAFT_26298 [Bipolaris maydis ATCC 48331]EMD86100.1 hypothetical protein COCHEDRAFT_1035155 [Bipolaris maydis C5]ENI02104.1 hypothetical protein COCC4DRAFT_26298 [Bipolaris maydis ATCC 48331]KAJ6203873.1 hypothetical protein PSV09DRAFT_1035155 [Bipolaris maydis]
MRLTLKPTTGDWGLPDSAEQSPIDETQFGDALNMSRELSSCIESFIAAAVTHTTNPTTSSEIFIRYWKGSFENCLNRFGAQYAQSQENLDNEPFVDKNAVNQSETSTSSG